MATPEYLDQNAEELVRLIKDGAIFLAPVGTAAPTSTEWTPTEDHKLVGYYSEDGYELTPVAGDETEILAHNGDPVVAEQAPGHWTVGFSGLEGNETVTAAYFDIDPEDIAVDGSFEVTKASNTKRYDLVIAGLDNRERVILAHFPSVQISEKEAMTFNRTTLLAYGMTFRTFRGRGDTSYHFKAFGFIADADAEVDPGTED